MNDRSALQGASTSSVPVQQLETSLPPLNCLLDRPESGPNLSDGSCCGPRDSDATAAKPIALLADWPEPAIGQTPQEAAVVATYANLNLRRWLRAAFGKHPVVEILLLQEVDDRLIGRLGDFGAIVILCRDGRPIPGEERLLALWSECAPARPILQRVALQPIRQPSQQGGG